MFLEPHVNSLWPGHISWAALLWTDLAKRTHARAALGWVVLTSRGETWLPEGLHCGSQLVRSDGAGGTGLATACWFSTFSSQCAMSAKPMRVHNIASSIPLFPNLVSPACSSGTLWVSVFLLYPAVFLGHQDPHILEITKMTLLFWILLFPKYF